jgi:hypothetical protein
MTANIHAVALVVYGARKPANFVTALDHNGLDG